MKGTYLKILTFAALLVGFAAFAPSNDACAGGGTIAQQTCDANVWKTMATRARIESEREIMQNQNLIFKPDSILHYTCFDSMAGHAAAQVGVLFTHTEYWKPKPLEWGTAYGMDTAVNNTVIKAMTAYYNGNFPHKMFGGRGGYIGGGADKMHGSDIKTASKSSQYSCSVMAEIWSKAKCINFVHASEVADKDGYYPYLNLTSASGGEGVAGYEKINDTRAFPTPCTPAKPFYDGDWKTFYHDSRNENSFGVVDKLYQFGTPLKKTHNEVRDKIEPGLCTGSSRAIKTGVKVILSTGSNAAAYDDGVCTNPGCTYNKNGQCSSTTVGSNGMVVGGN